MRGVWVFPLFPLWILLIVNNGHALIGYDCKHKDVEYSAVSVKDVATCKEVKPIVIQSTINIQLLQKRRLTKVPFFSCYARSTILITHCGMHSHASMTSGGLSQRIEPFSYDSCKRTIDTRTLSLFGVTIEVKNMNTTVIGSIIPFGNIVNRDASCTGASFAYEGTHYSASVMQLSYEIILKTGFGTYDSDSGLFITGLGSSGPYKENVLLDKNFGYVFWSQTDKDDCSNTRSYLVLYEGPAEKLLSHRDNRSIIVVEQESTTFSLQLREPTLLCSQHAFNTEHDQLKIIASANNLWFFKKVANSLDINLSTYINAKFVYVERHLRANIETLYEDVIKFRCLVTRQTLVNLLSLATIDADEFAFAYMGKPGYTSVKRGEVSYLIKCVPSYVTIANSKRCYNDVMIVHNNKTKFLASKTNIIQDFSEEVDCSQLTPVIYELQGKWYSVYPSPIAVPKPVILDPNREKEWEYKKPSDLAKSGIYTQENIDTWQKTLMLPASQTALTKIITNKFIGRDIDSQGSSIHTYLDENAMKHITKTFFVKAWGIFSDFGQIMSGVLGFIIIGKIIKLVIDSVMNGIALYRVYGFSVALLGCVWDNIAHLLISFRKDKKPTPSAPKKEDCVNDSTSKSQHDPLLRSTINHQIYPNLQTVNSSELV